MYSWFVKKYTIELIFIIDKRNNNKTMYGEETTIHYALH